MASTLLGRNQKQTKGENFILNLPKNYDKLTRYQRKLVKQEYIRIQNNKCWYCREDLNGPPADNVLKYTVHLKWFPDGFLDNPIHLQHDHNTGLTEGAVHAYCNAVLWEYFQR